jgi:thiamine-phosphate pyrophosphorylase
MTFAPPPVYCLVDAAYAADPLGHAAALVAAGATLVQLRAKKLTARAHYELALAMAPVVQRAGARFAVNDRADIAAAVGADVLHLGQDDLAPAQARKTFAGVIGLSTHDEAQVRAACEAGVDYIGFGPVFGTATKENPDPVVGLDGLARAVRASRVPVVAIGGITRARVPEVLAAGAASAALISALGRTPADAAVAFGEVYAVSRNSELRTRMP